MSEPHVVSQPVRTMAEFVANMYSDAPDKTAFIVASGRHVNISLDLAEFLYDMCAHVARNSQPSVS